MKPPSQRVALGEGARVHVVREAPACLRRAVRARRFTLGAWQQVFPDLLPQVRAGALEGHAERDAPPHGFVEFLRHVGRQDHQPFVALDLGEQQRVAPAEDLFALVEKQDGVLQARFTEEKAKRLIAAHLALPADEIVVDEH